MILKICIENIKGIRHLHIVSDIFPNKPNIFVASNGFGKSSLAIGFKSMNRNKINLDESNHYQEDIQNLPQVTLSYKDDTNNVHTLSANSRTNAIFSKFSCTVINNSTTIKTKTKNMGKFTSGSASLMIEPIPLVPKIPIKCDFQYKFREMCKSISLPISFIPNISNDILKDHHVISMLSESIQFFTKTEGVQFKKFLQDLLNEIGGCAGQKDTIIKTLKNDIMPKVKSNPILSEIFSLIQQHPNYSEETRCLLASIQIINLYNLDNKTFKAACSFMGYKGLKKHYSSLLTNISSSWLKINVKETNGTLLAEFPKITNISNGQRDIMVFVTSIIRAQKQLTKDRNILIIDEIFDYLDDANLVAAQYYISKLIEQFKQEGRKIYPIILTHLDPTFFRSYALKGQKVHYLSNNVPACTPDSSFVSLIKNRDNPAIKDNISKFLMHFNPENPNFRNDLHSCGLKETWGEGSNFNDFISEEIKKYLNDLPYCPLSVCCSLRRKIEENIYNSLPDDTQKADFLIEHKTTNKLEFAEVKGIDIPEIYSLLGIIYNDALHWKTDSSNNLPFLVSKLENATIKQMIKSIFNA